MFIHFQQLCLFTLKGNHDFFPAISWVQLSAQQRVDTVEGAGASAAKLCWDLHGIGQEEEGEVVAPADAMTSAEILHRLLFCTEMGGDGHCDWLLRAPCCFHTCYNMIHLSESNLGRK